MKTITKSMPLPTRELDEQGDALADDILAGAVKADRNTMKAAKGGAHAKFEPRAWSYGGQVD